MSSQFNSTIPSRLLIGHGLNQQPRIMEDLARELSIPEIKLSMIHLRGHRTEETIADLQRARSQDWIRVWKEALRHSVQEPLAVLTYSTGAAAYLCALQEIWQEEPQFPEPLAHIFLAPAFALRTTSHLPKFLRLLPKLVIPSASPRKSRIYYGTPVSAYLELFKLIEQLNSSNEHPVQLSNPALLAVHPDDELIDPRGCRDYLSRLTKGRLEVLLLNNQLGWTRPKYAHLICDRESLGDAQFQLLLQRIRLTLKGMT